MSLDRRRVMVVEEAHRLLTYARGLEGRGARRNYVMLALALNAGLRVSEVAALNLSDLRFDDKGAPVVDVWMSKRDRSRSVYLTPEMGDLLRAWVEDCRDALGDDAPMFFRRRMDGRPDRLTKRALQLIFKKTAADAGLAAGFTFHSLRHTFATIYFRNTRHLEGLREQLGHANLKTTAVYLHTSPEDHRQNARRLGPLGLPGRRYRPRERGLLT